MRLVFTCPYCHGPFSSAVRPVSFRTFLRHIPVVYNIVVQTEEYMWNSVKSVDEILSSVLILVITLYVTINKMSTYNILIPIQKFVDFNYPLLSYDDCLLTAVRDCVNSLVFVKPKKNVSDKDIRKS